MQPFSKNSLKWLSDVLYERFGIQFMLSIYRGKFLELSQPDLDGSINFDVLQPDFFQPLSKIPCHFWNAKAEGWMPVLKDILPAPSATMLHSPLVEFRKDKIVVHYDILGLIFWQLSRIEEIGHTVLDVYGRFLAKSSHAFKYEYLERPLVDEWLHILGQIIRRQWPSINLKNLSFSMHVSHDVDRPSRYAFQNIRGVLRGIGGDLLKNRCWRSALIGPWIWFNPHTQKIHPWDSHNTFEWIMDNSEQHGLRSTFYFMSGGSASVDARYKIDNLAIRNLMKSIHNRGHEIGLHPSFNSYQMPSSVIAEANRLRSQCARQGIKQESWGARMHYLRWQNPITIKCLEKAGIDYDATLAYPDLLGFRCGTCFEYPAFDPVGDKILNIRVRPLIAMDVTVLSDRYLGLSGEIAYKKFCTLKNACRQVGGCFTLLWHNNELITKKNRELYVSLL